MNSINESWRELIEDGETTVYANFFQRLHLVPQTRIMGFMLRRKIGRASLIGKSLWTILDFLQKITSITSPYAADLFWLRVEAAWVVKDYKYIPTKKFGMTYTFYRKNNLSHKEVNMLIAKNKVGCVSR
jgi:hypothetical protein